MSRTSVLQTAMGSKLRITYAEKLHETKVEEMGGLLATP